MRDRKTEGEGETACKREREREKERERACGGYAWRIKLMIVYYHLRMWVRDNAHSPFRGR